MMNVRFVVIVLLLTSLTKLLAQGNDTLMQVKTVEYKHAVKINLMNINEFIVNLNKQVIGLEYEYALTKRTSISIDVDAGLFNRYEYIKYYSFFQNKSELPYTRTTLKTIGFHISPQYNYYIFSIQNTPGTGLFINGSFDYFLYKNNLDYFDSRDASKSFDKSYYSSQFALGLGSGFQYLFFKRIALVFSVDMYYKLIDFTSLEGVKSVSYNADWKSENSNFWTVFKLKIGYTFGR